MNTDKNVWKYFLVGEIFDCQTCPSSIKKDLDVGKIPYISRTAMNNGRDGEVSVDSSKITKGNCITIGAEGFYAFYQEKDFTTGVKIYTLRCDEMDRQIGLFICTLLNLEVCKYNYGRARILEKIKKEKIKLPIDENNQPDWNYMRKVIKFIENREKDRAKMLLNIN